MIPLFLVFPHAHASIVSTTTPVIIDTFIDQGSPNSSGWSTDSRLIDGAFGGGNAYRPILRFTTPNITGTILNMELRMYARTFYGTNNITEIHELTGTSGLGWVQNQVTWNDYKSGSGWGSAGGDFSTTIVDSKNNFGGGLFPFYLYGSSSTNPISSATFNSTYNFIVKAQTETGTTNAVAWDSSRGSVPPVVWIQYDDTPISGGGTSTPSTPSTIVYPLHSILVNLLSILYLRLHIRSRPLALVLRKSK